MPWAEAAKYSQAAEAAAKDFNTRFLHNETGGYAQAGQSPQQCNQAQALFMGLVPPEQRAGALDVLVTNLASASVAGHMQGEAGYMSHVRLPFPSLLRAIPLHPPGIRLLASKGGLYLPN